MFLFTDRAPSSPAQPSAAEAVPFAQPLRQASSSTGVSFDYLVKTAERESRFNPAAKASTSSATGLFQFLEQTWLGTIKQEGSRLGFANEAAAISSDNGRYTVSDPAQRQRILALREDPAASAVLAGAFAARNGQQLKDALGRNPTDGELYIAHFLGASGAKELISQAQANPDAKAASFFRDAAAANRSVFYGRDGRAKTIGEVYAGLTGAYAPNPLFQVQQTAANAESSSQFFRAKSTDGGKPLHGLFRSNGEAVAPAVAAVWGNVSPRARAGQDEPTRVAFYPSQNRANGLIATDASTAPGLLAESSQRLVNVALPQRRPHELEALNALKAPRSGRKSAANVGQPLNLLRFVKAGLNP